ncbi:hypothetical protein SPRG_08783 [Saprolegnia parasitica CBS 223.65]|uniref:PH domain-containing protein n=1 Tax=Saprolegnia parasitica (strain CBS 223.65) TaxID=695850 RepID=A0A067C4Y6_SAPPC|nr:hypothetical protein SPRG_08783 [Saprolegnia parasitica CBS 223.65]KDO25839.1 hypothetical protein SPRG_08783 [Saprolegnia parasitica CBS 223.65]|eukprot:XP_012203403.1 hypothetical protein SPRG_08783 [Saprolegnia parasitica CBS 223.65]
MQTRTGHVVKNWRRRFFRLLGASLEYFDSHRHDAKRCGRIALVGATVAHGAAIGSLGEGVASAADERRFVFRVVDGSSHVAYYMCAEVPGGSDASRANAAAWVSCIQARIRAASLDALPAAVNTPFSATVVSARIGTADEVYELHCEASVVRPCADGLEEIKCSWILWHTRSDFAALDGHLRSVMADEMASLAFPTVHAAVSLAQRLSASSLQVCTAAFDAYVQQLLARPFIDQPSAELVLDFLEYAAHASQLPAPEHHATRSQAVPKKPDDATLYMAEVGRKLLKAAIAD